MSKRRNVRKPSYVVSDDDEDFMLPASKRQKPSQEKCKTSSNKSGARKTARERADDRDLRLARELSLAEPGHRYKENKKPASLDEENKKHPILVSSQSDQEVGGVRSRETCRRLPDSQPSDISSQDSSTAANTGTKKRVDSSDDEFRLPSLPDSSQSESEGEFALGSLTESEESGDEEFTLEKTKQSLKKPALKLATKVVAKKPKVSDSICKSLNSSSTNPPAVFSRTGGPARRYAAVPSRGAVPRVNLSGASGARVPNIPAILSSQSAAHSGSSLSQSAASSPSNIRIGLSKRARFKPLHNSVKRGYM